MAADWQQRRPAAGYGEQVAAPSPAAAGKQQTGRALGQSRSAELRVHATGGPTIIPLVCGAGELCRPSRTGIFGITARGVTSRGGGVRSCPLHAGRHMLGRVAAGIYFLRS